MDKNIIFKIVNKSFTALLTSYIKLVLILEFLFIKDNTCNIENILLSINLSVSFGGT